MSGKFREFHKFLSLVKFATKKTSEHFTHTLRCIFCENSFREYPIFNDS